MKLRRHFKLANDCKIIQRKGRIFVIQPKK